MQKILSGFGSEVEGNEYKGTSSSVHPEAKTKPTNQSNDVT
jgi:hypothetical protein